MTKKKEEEHERPMNETAVPPNSGLSLYKFHQNKQQDRLAKYNSVAFKEHYYDTTVLILSLSWISSFIIELENKNSSATLSKDVLLEQKTAIIHWQENIIA